MVSVKKTSITYEWPLKNFTAFRVQYFMNGLCKKCFSFSITKTRAPIRERLRRLVVLIFGFGFNYTKMCAALWRNLAGKI